MTVTHVLCRRKDVAEITLAAFYLDIHGRGREDQKSNVSKLCWWIPPAYKRFESLKENKGFSNAIFILKNFCFRTSMG